MLGSRLSIKPKRSFNIDRNRLILGKQYLIHFLKCSYETGELQNILGLTTNTAANINWEAIDFRNLYNLYINYLVQIQNTRPDYKPRQIMFCEHHIEPRFERGADTAENRVLLHYHEHGWVHLIRWLYSNSPRDLGGFSSNMRTLEAVQLDVFSKTSS